jgi:hypothetical protein
MKARAEEARRGATADVRARMALARELVRTDGLTPERRDGRRRAAGCRPPRTAPRARPRRLRLTLPPPVGGRQHPARRPWRADVTAPAEQTEEQADAPGGRGRPAADELPPTRCARRWRRPARKPPTTARRSANSNRSPRRRRSSRTPAAPTGEADRPRRDRPSGNAGRGRGAARCGSRSRSRRASPPRRPSASSAAPATSSKPTPRRSCATSPSRPTGAPRVQRRPRRPRPPAPQTPVQPTSQQIEADLAAAPRR